MTPHRQPELVKEAVHRILTRSLRFEPQINYLLKPLLEILIQYCDTDDSAQRSLFNDYLNSVILAFQNQNYNLILHVLVEEVTNNGSARTITAALLRIPHLIRNVQPIELGCDPQKLLKALIEIARRSDDESVLKALDATLKYVMPYLDFHVRKNREMQFLTNSLADILLRNLQNESSQTKRVAASSISNICSNSDLQLQNTLAKLKTQLDSLSQEAEASLNANKFVGFCLCVKDLPQFAEQHYYAIINVLLNHIRWDPNNINTVIASLETLRDLLLRFQVDNKTIFDIAKLLAESFLICKKDGAEIIKDDTKVILQSNALACIATIIKQQPTVLDTLGTIFLFKNHQDVAIRNQVIIIIGSYIEASWRFPRCVERSVDCERIRKLWVELRSILNDDTAHPDTLKSCVTSIKSCMNTLLESDHCLHMVEYQDFEKLIQLYLKSSFKPFKIETLSLFASLNYRTLHYLEQHHWSKLRGQNVGSLVDSLQDRIVKDVIIASLTDEHQRIRTAAASALVSLIPNLYITNVNNGSRTIMQRSSDPIVSLASNLANEHLIVLKQADEHICLLNDSDEPMINSELHEGVGVKNEHKFLTSSIIQPYDNPYNERSQHSVGVNFNGQHAENVSINLMYIVGLLKVYLENSLDKGKTAISSIVRTLYELSLTYPVSQYDASWDCRPSEYCDCFTLLNFLLTYLENLTEPDVVVEDLEAYRIFLAFAHQLLYALCHESVSSDYEHQRMRPYHIRAAITKEGEWSELTFKHPCIAEIFQTYFTHLVKLLWLIAYVIEEKSNPFAVASKSTPAHQQQKLQQIQETLANHDTLTSNRLLFGRVHKKLELSFKSSKKNLNQGDEKFYQMLETCLASMSSLLEFMSVSKSMEFVRDILSYLKITSSICSVSSLICARQLLKSLFGINIIAIYQVDPYDWFEEESTSASQQSPSLMSSQENHCAALQGVYHHLVSNPYKVFSSFHSMNCSQITPVSDKTLAILNFESRRALKVRRRIEDRVKSLFEINPHQIVSPKIKQISEILKNTIAEFTPIVTECMRQFNSKGFSHYQSEILHFMSYLLLLRVNYQKLPLAGDLITSINKLLDNCGERMFLARENGIEFFLRSSFTFLNLLTYERGPSKPMFQVATVIQKLDDLRAKLSVASATERDITTYVVPLLRCLVEDLFIYRTGHFQNAFPIKNDHPFSSGDLVEPEPVEQSKKDIFEILEAERETVAQKLLDVIDNPGIYDLLSILILESRRNSSEIKYKKLSQHLLSIIPSMLSRRSVNMTDYKRIELTRRIIENISPEVFQPVNFIFETLLEAPKPSIINGNPNDIKSRQEFQRWMSLVIITIHILTTQVKEEKFLSRIRENMSDEAFVKYLLHIAQLCMAEILLQLSSPIMSIDNPNIVFLTQQLSSYILYLTHMFQSGLFFQLTRSATDLIRKEIRIDHKGPKILSKLLTWARDPSNDFSINVCEIMFYNVRLIYPDLTIFWCNVMMLLNNVDCNRDYWRNLLVYECHQCLVSQEKMSQALESLIIDSEDTTVGDMSIDTNRVKATCCFKRSAHINRPSSLNLSDISLNDQLRRSFIKKIAASESRDKAFNRNIIETNDEDGQLLEREVNIGNTEQCLAPNIELTRRGALCLVLDFVSISMNDVEHITWLIIHHINDIVRWSHEMPVAEFINAVHGNSASSGIFIQAISSNFNNLTSISFVTRLLWTLEQVHYTQYGSLVVLLVEKLLSSQQLLPYRSLTKKIEEFACETVQKLLNETNKSLVTTNEEVINQLSTEDLDRIISILDGYMYPKLIKLLKELRESSQEQPKTPIIEFNRIEGNSDEDSDGDELEILYSRANLIYWLAEQGYTAQISTLIPALNTVKSLLIEPLVIERLNKDETLVCFLMSSVYSLVLNILPPPTRLSRPKFWSNSDDSSKNSNREFTFDNLTSPLSKPIMPIGSKRSTVKAIPVRKPMPLNKKNRSKSEIIEEVRLACLEGLFLFDNIDCLQVTQFECLNDLIILLARLPMINSFILTPPSLWRLNIWPTNFPESDEYKTIFPMVTHDVLSKDYALLEDFCDRILRLGWINRRQFEEAWMTLLGVLSATLSQGDNSGSRGHDERRANLLASCKVVTTLTKFLALTRKNIMGHPLAPDTYTDQSFDSRVLELTRAIGTNLTSLRKKTKSIFEMFDLEKRQPKTDSSDDLACSSKHSVHSSDIYGIASFNHYLKVPAQKLRMSSILNAELNMQDTVVIDDDQSSLRPDEVDVESCIRLLLSIYKQKLKEPNEDIFNNQSELASNSNNQQRQQQQKSHQSNVKDQPNQLAPPLTTAICQSMLALSDMFTDYEQFDWLFETFVQMFRLAERNEDEIQMQYLIIGLCKATAVRCYEVPSEVTTISDVNHRGIMFEKCRQSIEKCLKSNFSPLKLNALHGIYYMLEDSVNIVASGAWELDDFKLLRQSRLTWILRLMPIILDRENSKLLTNKSQTMKLLESLCDTVSEFELKSIRV